MMKKIIFYMLLIFSLSVVRADESTPLVVWVENGDLVVWENGTSQIFSVGNLVIPKLSPSGEQVALLRGQYPYIESLSVIGIDGANLWDIDISYPRQIEWQSETILWVNTYLPPAEGMLNLLPSTMLYRVDLETNTITQWDMEHEFNFSLNPQKTWIALVLGGIYEQTDTRVAIFSTNSSPVEAQEVLSFPTISSASHAGFLPDVQWITETTARIPIREPDAIYATKAETPLTTLMEFSVLGETKTLGLFPASFLLGVTSSSDGNTLAYITEGKKLLITSMDGQVTYQEADLTDQFILYSPMSIPETTLFGYIQDISVMMLAGEETPPTAWFIADEAIEMLQIGLKGSVIMLSQVPGISTLHYVRMNDSELHQIAEIREYYTFFDIKWD